jgi:hypothetical protein
LQRILPAHRASRLWYDLVGRREAEVIRQASLVVMNNEPCRDAMRARYGGASDRIMAVTNGFDEQESLPSPIPADGRFLITYSGTLYFVYQNPDPFFAAIARLVTEYRLSPGQLGIEFIGHADEYNGVPTRLFAERAGIGAYFQCLPFQPRGEVLQSLSRATVLVSLAQLNDLAVPSKLFDYMLFPAWILAIGEPGSATESVLRGTDADLVPANDSELIYQALRRRYHQFRQGERPAPIAPGTHWSRREQAGILFTALNRAVGEAGGRS